MRPSANAAAMGERLVRQCEGCRLHPYQDSAGVWTIGIGSIRLADGSPVTATTLPITSDEADALLMGELSDKIAKVDALIPPNATDGQRAALYSFTYEEGVGAFALSTLLRKFHAGDIAGAEAEFPKWVYAGGHVVQGIVNRRSLELAVFQGKVIP